MIRKITVVGIVIFMLLVSISCSKEDVKTGEDEISEAETPSVDYQAAFESVEVSDEGSYISERSKLVGDIVEAIDSNTLLCTSDNKILIYDFNEGTTRTLAEDSWNIRLSQDRNKIAYENDQGIYVMDIEGKGEKQLYERSDDQIVRDYILSSDGSKALITLIEKNDYVTIIADSNGVIQYLPLDESENFSITKPLYLTRYRLYALVETREMISDGEDVTYGSMVDFVYVELDSGDYRNITRNVYGNTVEYVDRSDSGNIILRSIKKTTNEDGLIETEEYKTFNTSTEYIYSSGIESKDINLFKSINDDKDFITVEDPVDLDYRYPKLVLIKQYTDHKATLVGTIFTGNPSQIFYRNDSIFFNSNGDTYRITIIN
ncbi:hypothetical protein [Alkalibacter mobilis]|uniref:hypothetical protein n=1 Tax=Alkalibacter mobilis TaxID=2787712 RepID=UPI00189EF405|nr:hypothetical protein [Alkalibacter mobilis]MBF7095779.1 hypothetical protein [Alkalibacter mobilis]